VFFPLARHARPAHRAIYEPGGIRLSGIKENKYQNGTLPVLLDYRWRYHLQKSRLARSPKIVAVDTLDPAGSTICKSNVTRLAGVRAIL
jgi:hypothetical protein